MTLLTVVELWLTALLRLGVLAAALLRLGVAVLVLRLGALVAALPRLGVEVVVLRLGVVVERIGVVAVLLGVVAVLRVAELGLVVVMRFEFVLLPVELLRLGVVAVVVWDERLGVVEVDEDERFVVAEVVEDERLGVVEVDEDERFGLVAVVEDERFVLAADADEDLLSVDVEREVLPDERETVVVDREAVEDWDEDALVEVVLLCAIPGMTAASDTAIAKRAVVVFFIVRQ